jgi:hypothetical protein
MFLQEHHETVVSTTRMQIYIHAYIQLYVSMIVLLLDLMQESTMYSLKHIILYD